MKKLKILVIDDNLDNLAAAERQLIGHDLTLCSSFKEAQKYLNQDPCIDGMNNLPLNPESWDYGRYYHKGESNYDVVLTDLFLPVCLDGLGDNNPRKNEHVGTEKPYGLFFVLLALRRGVKKIAIVTNAGHHDDPLIWSLEKPLGFGRMISFGENDFVFSCNSAHWENDIRVKDWLDALNKLGFE